MSNINREIQSLFFQPTDDSPEARRYAAEAKRKYRNFFEPEPEPPSLGERLSAWWYGKR
jgi:hypothetical protein